MANIKAEFNMGQMDQYRLDAQCKNADEIAYMVIAGDSSKIDWYISALKGVYRMLRAFKGHEAMGAYDRDLKEILALSAKIKRTKVPLLKDLNELIDKLDEFHYKIYRFKQLSNLGMPTDNVRSRKRLMEEALGAR